MLSVQIQPMGHEAQRTLREAIRALQSSDPVRAVTVAVPSNYAGLALRRALARPAGGDHGGLLNVRFMVLPRVMELLGAPVLAARGQRPLTRAIQAELIRLALVDEPGVFEGVAEHPSTEQRLASSFRELGELTSDERSALAAAGGTAGSAARLFDRVEALADGRYYDDRALAAAATEAARSGHAALRDLGALVIYLPGPLGRADRAFIGAFAEQQEVTVIPGVTGDAVADRPVLEQWGAEESGASASGDVPVATQVVSAPDAEEEVRQAVRMVVARMEAGVPPHRIAILSRHASPYSALLAGQLRAAEIPWSGTLPETLAQSVAGRALLGLLALPGQRFQRSAVTAWLAASPVLTREHGELVPAHRWDMIARSAGIVAGADQWVARLEAHESRLRYDLERHERDDDPAEWRLTRLQRDIGETVQFREFMVELIEALEVPSGDAASDLGWPELVSWAEDLLTRYVGTEASFAARLPEDLDAGQELEAYRSVSDARRGLTALGEIRPAVDLPTFQRTLVQELDRPARRVSRFGEGVFVGRLAHAMGADFDHLFILGMNEGSIPMKGSDDPLLPDHAWDVVGQERARAGRSRRARARAEERRTYLAALASAPERTLLAPRADLRGSQGLLRSRWLIESASRLAGERLTNEGMERFAAPWHTVVPSFEGGLASEAPASSLAEHDLRLLRRWQVARRPMSDHPLTLDAPVLATGWEVQRARRSRALTRWDGHAAPLPDSVMHRIDSAEHSPTSLQRWATCPRQYFFASVLGIGERDEPEEHLRISARDRGTLVHDILDRFIQERRPAEPGQAWASDDRARLLEIAESLCNQMEADGITGTALLWRLDRAAIMRELQAFIATDEEHRRTRGVLPADTELRIGGARTVEVVLDDGRTVRLRGQVDRVDRSLDGGRVVVLDYKTGKEDRYRKLAEDPVRGGQLLQLPVYALGAEREYGSSEVEAYYWFTSQAVEERRRFAGYEVSGGVRRRFSEALGLILDGISAGVFASVPGTTGRDGGFVKCTYCAYDSVCSRARGREFEQKIGDPVMLPFIDLGGPDVTVGEGDDGDGGDE